MDPNVLLKKIYCLAQKELNLTLKIHIKMKGAPTTVNKRFIATYIIIQNIREHIHRFTQEQDFINAYLDFFWTRIAIFLQG